MILNFLMIYKLKKLINIHLYTYSYLEIFNVKLKVF